jgi:methylglyoxal synthase
MTSNIVSMPVRKRIALIAHDSSKPDLLAWVKHNQAVLLDHELYATGATGKMISDAINIQVFLFKSGPLGGDMQIGARIAEGDIDFLIFFWDPLEPQPHDPDIKALLRLAVLYNIPTACNRATADFMISSPFMTHAYNRTLSEYDARLKRIYPADGNDL